MSYVIKGETFAKKLITSGDGYRSYIEASPPYRIDTL